MSHHLPSCSQAAEGNDVNVYLHQTLREALQREGFPNVVFLETLVTCEWESMQGRGVQLG